MAPLRLQKIWFICGWLMVATIVVLSLMPVDQAGPSDISDKIKHLTAYFTLMAWFGALFSRRHHGYLLVGLILLGIMLEGLQGLTVHREPSLLDVAANTTGVILAWLLVWDRLRIILDWFERQLFQSTA